VKLTADRLRERERYVGSHADEYETNHQPASMNQTGLTQSNKCGMKAESSSPLFTLEVDKACSVHVKRLLETL